MTTGLPLPYVYVWGNNPVRARLKGRRCRIVAASDKKNTVIVRFEDDDLDGVFVISRMALRKVRNNKETPGDQQETKK